MKNLCIITSADSVNQIPFFCFYQPLTLHRDILESKSNLLTTDNRIDNNNLKFELKIFCFVFCYFVFVCFKYESECVYYLVKLN